MTVYLFLTASHNVLVYYKRYTLIQPARKKNYPFKDCVVEMYSVNKYDNCCAFAYENKREILNLHSMFYIGWFEDKSFPLRYQKEYWNLAVKRHGKFSRVIVFSFLLANCIPLFFIDTYIN